MPHDCSDCGRPARAGGRQCPRCYQRRYRSTEAGRRRHNEAVIRYNARHPEKHLEWSRRWKYRTGQWSPELQAIRSALGKLDAALAITGIRDGVRGPGERGSHTGSQRRD